MTYRLTRRAKRDVVAIWVHIAEDNEDAADRFLNLLTGHFQLLAKHPYAGRSRSDLRAGYRSFPLGQHLIFYVVSKAGVRIMRVLHGRRDIATQFEQ